MSTLVVGSIALDTVETPYGRTEDALGGTATYFSIAASHFTDVKIVGVVGSDFPSKHVGLLSAHGCDLDGLQRAPGNTFRWVGRYDENMNIAHTLDTQLNVFEHFSPNLPSDYRHATTVFLGNIAPTLQLDVLEQVASPKLVALDTMNFWIEGARSELDQVIRRVDVVLINEDEARQFSGVYKIAEAARYIKELGPKIIVIKRGEYGSALFSDHGYFALPAFPTDSVRDTTGAGDSFAGGFLGYLDSSGGLGHADLRRALAIGTVIASFTVEDFSVGALSPISGEDIENRYETLRQMTALEPAGNMEVAGVR